MTASFDRRSRSLWMDIDVAPNARQLEGDQSCDTVVVGAGMAGISTAYELAIEGQKVVVIDRGAIAGGITARTSAHLAPLCDDLTSAMIKVRGEDMSRAFYESQAAAVDRIEEIQKNIECDFRRLDGFLFQALNTDSQIIDDELEAVRKVGAPVHRIVGVEALAGCERQHALRYPQQGTFHPLKYLRGLVAAIEAKGGLFYADTVVRTVEDDAGVRFDALEAWARNLIPKLGKVSHRWSGQVLDTIDYAAFIGRNPGHERIYVHTGDSGQGITHGVAGSLLNSALILGKEPKWVDVYDPSRKTPSAIGNFLRENTTVVKSFAEYLAPGELSSLDQLKPGHGAIVRQGLSKIAAYRDESGELHTRSAACTHLGCHLHWNSFECCWDCPCHGSHFAIDGTPLNAPAISGLAEAG